MTSKSKRLWFNIISDLFVNLSAGWYGASLIIPTFTESLNFNFGILILNVSFGTVSLLVAYQLRK